jgi:hypothetical protein
MGLINSIGAYFNKFLGGWTFGTQTDQLTMKNSAEIVGTTGVIYEHTFQNKNGIVAHLDDITISLPTDTTGAILFLDSLNQMDTNGALFNYTTNGLFVKGVSAQNVLTLLNNTNSVLLSVENSGILNVGTSNINLLQNTGIENDLLYFDIANGRIGIGTSTPQTTLSIRSQGTNSTRGLLIEHTDNTTAFSHAKIIGSRSRGSHGSPSAVLANDSLVSFNARGYKATGWSDTVGGMYVYASENWTNTNTPTYITFRGVPSSSTTPTEWARLNSTGLGIGVSPTASLHVKGVSDTVGNVFVAQNLSNNEIFRLQNDRDIVIGGGSASADTQVTINPFRAPATTNFVLQVNAGTNNFMRFINSPGSTTGGLYISRDATSIGRYALSVGGAGGTSFVLTSNGSIGINTATAGSILPAEVFNNGIINSNVAGKNGQYFLTAGTDRGFIFEHLGTGSFNTTQAVFQISKSLTDAGPGTGLDKLFEINGTYNFTNGTKGLIGINYNPTITALSGAHYGLVVRPSGTLNGIGLGSSLPTATWHIKGNSDSVGNAFLVESLSQNRLIIGNDGKHAINTTVDANFNLKIRGDDGFLYENAAGTRYIRFKALPDGNGNEPLDIRTNNTGGNSTQMFIRNQSGNINLKLSSAAGAGYYLSLGSNLSSSVFAYLENGLRNFGALQVQGANNQNVSGHNDFAAVGIIAVGDIGLSSGKQSALSIQSTHTNTSIAANYSLLRLHNNTTFTFTSGGNTVRGIDLDYTINQTGGTTSFIGIDYQPTLTSITGAHYGLIIRPNTLNGIGLGATLPTANLQIKGSGTTTGSSLLVQNSSNVTNFEVLNSSASSIRIGVNNITTEIKGGGSVDPILTVLRGASGLSIQHSSGVPELTTISSSAGLQIVSADNTLINIGNQSSTTKIFVSSRAGATITDYNFMVRDNGSRGIAFYTGNQNFDRAIQSLHDNAATILKIQPYGGNIALGHGSNTPSATLHVKGNSDSVGNMFVAENLSNTANLTLANSGVSTFNFSTGGKVVIAGAVGSGDTLLEIRRTSASSGGFIFRSGNALSQEIYTTNGSMYLVTSADNSDIYFSTGNGRVFVNTALANMSGFNTGFQFRVGVQGGSILNRWLNFGHHANYGMILQAVQNGNTPAIDSLAINPYGGITTLCAELANSFVDVLVGSGTGMRVYRGSATNGVVFKVGNGLGFGLMIEHLDTTNASTWGDIRIIQSNSGFFSAGRITGGTTTKNHLYGRNYGALSSYNTLIGHYYNEAAGTERGILFSSTDTVSLPSIIQSVHSGATKELSLQYYGGNVSVGGIQPTALLDLAASTTSRASLRIRNGVAPSSPNDGDIWTETNDIKIRLNGVTYTLVKI